jgi:hypothetical protein
MNSSKFRFSLELHSTQSQISLPVLIGDTSRSFHISLTDGGVPYVIEDGCLAKLSVKRPTGTHFEELCAIKDNATIVYDFIQNKDTCAVKGIHICDVVLYGIEGEILASPKFTMIVSDRVIVNDDINVSDDDRHFVDAVAIAEVERVTAENNRVEAESERVEAESERVEAESERVEAESERVEAESERVEAESERVEAEKDRKTLFAEMLEGVSKIIEANLLPDVTEADDGKILCVVNGKWAAQALESAEEVSV